MKKQNWMLAFASIGIATLVGASTLYTQRAAFAQDGQEGQEGGDGFTSCSNGVEIGPENIDPPDTVVSDPPPTPEPTVVTTVPEIKPLKIRFFVLQGGGKRGFEIRRGSKVGGRFMSYKKAGGTTNGLPSGVPIVGYTDRASVNERIHIFYGGGNIATVGVNCGTTKKLTKNVSLSTVVDTTVPRIPGKSTFAYILQNNNRYAKRIPVGPR
jgi:hypothetical protein